MTPWNCYAWESWAAYQLSLERLRNARKGGGGYPSGPPGQHRPCRFPSLFGFQGCKADGWSGAKAAGYGCKLDALALAVALRASDGSEALEAPLDAVFERLLNATKEMVEAYAPTAPVAVQDEATIRTAGFLYDSTPGRTLRTPWDFPGPGPCYRPGGLGEPWR